MGLEDWLGLDPGGGAGLGVGLVALLLALAGWMEDGQAGLLGEKGRLCFTLLVDREVAFSILLQVWLLGELGWLKCSVTLLMLTLSLSGSSLLSLMVQRSGGSSILLPASCV